MSMINQDGGRTLRASFCCFTSGSGYTKRSVITTSGWDGFGSGKYLFACALPVG